MIDLNTIISNALTAAINNAVSPLNERIAALEEKVNFLEDQAVITDNRTHARISALENNPAQGVDTQAPSVLAAQYTPVSNDQIKAALQEWATKDALVEYLDSQEWFWEKLQNRIDSTVEAAMDTHLGDYDHDDYDSIVSKVEDMPDFDDYVTRDSVREEIEDVLNNAPLSLSI